MGYKGENRRDEDEERRYRESVPPLRRALNSAIALAIVGGGFALMAWAIFRR